MDIARWEHEVDRLRVEWSTVCSTARTPMVPPDVNGWEKQLSAMQATMARLQEDGQWAAGPHDLLSIVGLNRWELAHSAALAWLCTPDAGHGLGTKFLETLIALTGEPVRLDGLVTTALEESRRVGMVDPTLPAFDDSGANALTMRDAENSVTRADVVVRGPGWALLIEVKVDATEQPDQAQRLYQGWKDEGDARFIFLTRGGGLPVTIAPQLRGNWTGVAWRDLRATLQRLSDEANPRAAARAALLDYVRTLHITF